MAIKTLQCLFGGEADELGALHTAFALTRAHGATLRILHVAAPPIFYDAITQYGLSVPAGDAKVSVLEKAARDLTVAAQAYAADVATHHGIPLHFEGAADLPLLHAQFRTAIGTAKSCLPQAGRTVDLIVTAYDNDPLGDLETVLAALFQCGRPVLLIPRHPGRDTDGESLLKTVVLAWDGSLAAGRAVRDAIPLMQQASSVYLLCAEEAQDTPGAGSQSDVLAYLHSHGIVAEILDLPRDTHSVGETLITQAGRLGADVLVMGAYGAGHVGEMILGGATNYVIKHTHIPLLLAH